MMPDSLNADTPQNEDAYENLLVSIEASEGVFSMLIAACDDRTLREQIIRQYEQDLFPEVLSYRLQLNRGEPSLRAAVAQWEEQHQDVLRQERRVVLTVTGAEELLWLNLRSDSPDKSELDKFFGYLQWTREAIGRYPYPIVLWVTHRILRSLSLKAPDFWSWRKGVFRFESEFPSLLPRETVTIAPPLTQPKPIPEEDEFALPLPDLQNLIATTEQEQGLEAPTLATLYDRIAQIYKHRIQRGEAEDLEQEKELAIAYFQKAIALQTKLNLESVLVNTLNSLGWLYNHLGQFQPALTIHQQALEVARRILDCSGEASALRGIGSAFFSLGQYSRAIEFHQQSLEIQQEIGDRKGKAGSLNNLGNAYNFLGQYSRAIEFLQQSLEIQQEIGDRKGEATSLINLGNAYHFLGQYSRAIEFYQQSLETRREIGDRKGEASSLNNLGSTFFSLGQYSRAIEFYQQSLEIKREIGDRKGEASSLFNKGESLAKLDRKWEAINAYRAARELFRDMGLEHKAQECDTAIYNLGQVVPIAPQIQAPDITPQPKPIRQRKWLQGIVRWLMRLWLRLWRVMGNR